MGNLPADRGGIRPDQFQFDGRCQRRARLFHGHLHGAGRGAAPESNGDRARQPVPEKRGFLHAGPRYRRQLLSCPWTEARLRAPPGDWTLRILDLRSRESKIARQDRIPGPPAHGFEDKLERKDPLYLPGREHDRPLRCRQLQLPTYLDTRWRPDHSTLRDGPGRAGIPLKQSTLGSSPKQKLTTESRRTRRFTPQPSRNQTSTSLLSVSLRPSRLRGESAVPQ